MAAQIIPLIPSLLWFGLVVALVVLFYRPIRDDLLPNLSGFKAGGVELSFVRESIEAAIELGEKAQQWKVDISPADKEHALQRAKRHLPIFKDAQILWVDDLPENNVNERRMFRQLRVHIDLARSTDEALSLLKTAKYDLILSDMKRGDDPAAGLELLRQGLSTPLIFYVGVSSATKGVPPQAFGLTNRPDELLHLTLDALERKRS